MTDEIKDTLKVLLEAELKRLDQIILLETSRLDKIITEFKQATAHSFVQVNEFRGSLDDLSKNMATRREINALEESMSTQMTSMRESTASQIAAVRELIAVNAKRLDEARGAKRHSSDSLAWIVAIASIAVAIITALVGFFN